MKYVLGRGVTLSESMIYPDEEFVFLDRSLHWKPNIINAVLFDTREQAVAEKQNIEQRLADEIDLGELEELADNGIFEEDIPPAIVVVAVDPESL